MTYQTLSLELEEPIAVLTLNRPEKRNAISRLMMDELLVAFDALESGSSRVAILAGVGPAFCAGMDLDDLRQFPSRSSAQVEADARRIARLFRRVYGFPKPLVGAVNGPALAGGCGLATFADFTLASEAATFGYTEVRVGFIPAIVSSFLIRQVGEKRARELLLSGRILSAMQAKDLGLVNEIVPAGKLAARARELAQSLARMSPVALARTKRLLLEFTEAEIEKELEAAVQASAAMRTTQDFREGLAAFLEKRPPRWTGR